MGWLGLNPFTPFLKNSDAEPPSIFRQDFGDILDHQQ